MKIVMIGPTVRQAMDQRRVAVEGKNDRLVLREDRVVVAIGKAMRVLTCRLQFHQIDDVDDPNLQVLEMSS